jgi:hypothetical protein
MLHSEKEANCWAPILMRQNRQTKRGSNVMNWTVQEQAMLRHTMSAGEERERPKYALRKVQKGHCKRQHHSRRANVKVSIHRIDRLPRMKFESTDV